jgi:anti-sigma-K factor RskA
MAQAGRTFITRRHLVAASAVLVPATRMPLSSPARTPPEDPIFAAINAHARAYAELLVLFDAQSAAEKALRQAIDETRPTLEARLDEALAAEGPLGLIEIDASQRLVSTIPATLSGAAAVLRYVRELFERDKYALCEDDGCRALLYSTECAILAGLERA